uniref:NlpC/P60 domain-containing protein n=1 Tax=uncultured Armatimonadetes bacterium TaxID=157466 RepID=A0A6J4JPC5_9BACT|nr:hypothetical protein AVDCRST_MAG63-3796 [uncultured Armatimonadetes bacterium]
MSLHRFLAAAVVLASAGSASPFAHAQSGTSTLDLTLNTSPRTSPRSGVRGGGRAAVSSRGGTIARREAPQQSVLGRLAQVAVDKTPIRRGRDGHSAVLSVVPQGTYLAIVSEVGDHYGVLMIDRTTGWLPKASAQMIEYQVAVGDPNLPPPPSAPEPPAFPGGGDAPTGLPEGLDARTAALLREAFSYLGVPYVWAGNTRSGLDCSGFVKNVFASQGVSLPRHSGDQARVGEEVPWEGLQAGDRLYFDMGRKGRISHTGIYLGNGYFIHASSNQKKVGVDSLMKANYYKSLVCARRS